MLQSFLVKLNLALLILFKISWKIHHALLSTYKFKLDDFIFALHYWTSNMLYFLKKLFSWNAVIPIIMVLQFSRVFYLCVNFRYSFLFIPSTTLAGHWIATLTNIIKLLKYKYLLYVSWNIFEYLSVQAVSTQNWFFYAMIYHWICIELIHSNDLHCKSDR